MPLTRAEQRTILIKAEGLTEQGFSTIQICEILSIERGELRALRRQEILIFSVPGPWENEHLGKRWTDMPGFDWFSKRCNFALFRRGFPVFDKKQHGIMKRRGRPRKLKLDPESVDNATIEPVVPEFAW